MIAQAIFGLALLLCLTHAQVVFNTLSGPVRGKRTYVNGKSIDVLLSIPFAKPPTGSLRFKPPQPVDPWTETLDATKPSAACLQVNPNAFIKNEATHPMHFRDTYSEDCLYLNIWKPSSATRDSKLPVMLYIHGESFKDVPLYNGQFYTANNGVILATINYRVGLLGFGYLGSDTLPGNLGLLDQLEAMKWIQNNIEYFGGDPMKITIFGENAGSWYVGLHLISPLSAAYFDKAIMQSGSPLNKILSSVVYPQEISRQNVKNLAIAIGCPTHTDLDVYTCLMNATTDALAKGTDEVSFQSMHFYPVVDGYFLQEPPLDLMKKGFYKKTNLLMGVEKDAYSFAIGSFINPVVKTIYNMGKKLSYDTLGTVFGSLPLTNRWNDKQKVEALKAFYGSSVENPDEEIIEVLNDITSDLVVVCPVQLHASLASHENDVYFYTFKYRLSSKWISLTLGYDLEPTLGKSFYVSTDYASKELEVRLKIMTYWSNFAKTGNPNSPVPVTTNWPTFNYTDQFYMEVDYDASFTTRQGPRRHECSFVNEILPTVQGEWTTPKPCEWPQIPTNKGSHVRLGVWSGLAAAAIVMMMLQ